MVQTMPAEVPERSRARAKMVPATGARVEESRSWMVKRSASSAPGREDREEPATMRIELLTKSAKVTREMASSAMLYDMHERMAASEGRYLESEASLSSSDSDARGSTWSGVETLPEFWSNSRRRACTMPLPR